MRPVSSCLTLIALSTGLALICAGPASALQGAGFHGGGHAVVGFGHAGSGHGFHHGFRGFDGRHDGGRRFGWGRGYGRHGYGRYGFNGYGYGYDGFGLGYGGYGEATGAGYPAAGSGGFVPVFIPVAIGIRPPPVKPPALYIVEQRDGRLHRPRWRRHTSAAPTGRPRSRVAVLDGAGRPESTSTAGPRIILVPQR